MVPKFTYMRTPLYRYTFRNNRIREWVEEHVEGKFILNLFAGKYSLNLPDHQQEIRNDIREDMPADYHMDALQFCNEWAEGCKGPKFGTVILDPPYAYRKSMEMYDGAVSSAFNQVKNKLLEIIEKNSIILTFGYHSNVMGKRRGFTQEHILLMSHGGAIHDTLCTVERLNSGITRKELGEFF